MAWQRVRGGKNAGRKLVAGAETPLVFHRDKPFVAAEEPSPIDGICLGTNDAPGANLRVQVHNGSVTHRLRDHIAQRLNGEPAIWFGD